MIKNIISIDLILVFLPCRPSFNLNLGGKLSALGLMVYLEALAGRVARQCSLEGLG